MTLDESLVLTNLTPKMLSLLVEEYPVINRIIQYKEMEFKKKLMSVLVNQIRKGSDGMAQWLLEKRYPEEYGKKGVGASSGSPERSMFEKALAFVQGSRDSSPLAANSSGTPVEEGSEIQNVGDVLAKLEKYLV